MQNKMSPARPPEWISQRHSRRTTKGKKRKKRKGKDVPPAAVELRCCVMAGVRPLAHHWMTRRVALPCVARSSTSVVHRQKISYFIFHFSFFIFSVFLLPCLPAVPLTSSSCYSGYYQCLSSLSSSSSSSSSSLRCLSRWDGMGWPTVFLFKQIFPYLLDSTRLGHS